MLFFSAVFKVLTFFVVVDIVVSLDVDVAVVVVVVVVVAVAVVVVVVGQLDRGACVTCDAVRSRRGCRCNDCRAGTATSNFYLHRLGPTSLDTIDPQRNRTVLSSFFATVTASSELFGTT